MILLSPDSHLILGCELGWTGIGEGRGDEPALHFCVADVALT